MRPQAQLLLLLLAAPALAQGKPTLIDYPLDVKAPVPQAQQTELQNDFRMLLARNPAVLLSTKTQWKASVAALKRQDCDVRDECLQQLATTASTLYALYASVQQNAAGTEVIATGRVVNQDRQTSRGPLSFTAPKQSSFNDAAREALGKLVTALELEKLSPTLAPPTPPAPPVASGPPPPPAPSATAAPAPTDLVLVLPALPPAQATEQQQAGNPLRSAAWVTGGLGVAAAGVAAGFGISAAVGRTSLPVDGQLLDESQARAQLSVNRDASIALGSSIGAGVLLTTAIVLFITSAPPSAPVVSLAPAAGGAHLTLTGEF